MTVGDGDVFILTGNGGGGVGDPLLRSVKAVLWDLCGSYISPEAARAIYGVVVDCDSQVDIEGTARLRDELRFERIGMTPSRQATVAGRNGGVGERDGKWVCRYCDAELAPVEENFRHGTILRESPLVEHHRLYGMHIRARPPDEAQFVLREYFCPSCASSVVVDTTLFGSLTVPSPRLDRTDTCES
jgi:N-methylhydantoinase B